MVKKKVPQRIKNIIDVKKTTADINKVIKQLNALEKLIAKVNSTPIKVTIN